MKTLLSVCIALVMLPAVADAGFIIDNFTDPAGSDGDPVVLSRNLGAFPLGSSATVAGGQLTASNATAVTLGYTFTSTDFSDSPIFIFSDFAPTVDGTASAILNGTLPLTSVAFTGGSSENLTFNFIGDPGLNALTQVDFQFTPTAGLLGFTTSALTAVPEPATMVLFGLAGFGAFGLRRRKQAQRPAVAV